MDIPLITSIWRGLAGMDDSLRPVWDAAKPIYASREPERALARSITTAGSASSGAARADRVGLHRDDGR